MASSEILNPETPLAFLDPVKAGQFEVSRYLLTATCGMFAWDVLINMRNDYHMLTKYRIAPATVIYFLSRIASFAYIITSTVFMIGPVGNCQALQVALGSCFAAAVPLTSLLFLFRVRAIFHHHKWVVAVLSFMWLGTAAGSITVPFAITGQHIGPTDHCINTAVKNFSSSGIVITAVNDTILFFCISWKLLSSSAIDPSFKTKAKIFISGKGLPVLTKTLLQSGQEYYLVTVVGNIITMSMILGPESLPAFYRAMPTVANVAIGNAMACYLYRDIRFGRINSTSDMIIPAHSESKPVLRSMERRNNRRTFWRDHKGFNTQMMSCRDTVGSKLVIHVTESITVHESCEPPMAIDLPSDSRRISTSSDSAQLA